MGALRSDTLVIDCAFHRNVALGAHGGISNRDGDLTVTRCVFTENLGVEDAVAGLGNRDGTTTIIDSLFLQNRGWAVASSRGELELARSTFERNLEGGVYSGEGGAVVRDCVFEKNGPGKAISAYGPLIVDRCLFIENVGVPNETSSAALNVSLGPAWVTDSLFVRNHARASAVSAVEGELTIVGCRFEGNVSGNYAGAIRGRAAELTIIDCVFEGNRTDEDGGALHTEHSTVSIQRTTFVGNQSFRRGGAVFLQTTVGDVSNSLFARNQSGCEAGGGLFIGSASNLMVTNCTLAENESSCEGAAGLHVERATVGVANCILFGNRRDDAHDEPAQITDERGRLTIDFSCVEGWTGDLGGTGNIGDDPRFADPEGGDFRLLSGSPTIDAADNARLGDAVDRDLDANPRFVDDPDIDDAGAGACPVVDMGAYEFQAVGGCCLHDPRWRCDGDVDGDGQVNPADSGIVQSAFGSMDEQALCNYDLDCNGQINPTDSSIVQSLFGTCEPPRDGCR